MTGLPLIQALDLRPPNTEAAPPDEYVWDWPIAPTFTTAAPTFTTAAPAPAVEAGDGRGEKEERTQ